MARIVLEKLDGGLNQSNPELLKNEESQACENIDFAQILGGFVTRKGSVALNTAALGAAILGNFKLYNTTGNYRYTNAGTTQFRNFVAFKTGLAAARVTAAAMRDQAFFSDGTNLWADDGTSATPYNWGITAPVNSLAVSTGTVNSSFVAHFDNTGTNSEAWTSLQGTQSFDGSIKKEGNQSLSIVADTASFAGISTLSLASAVDFSQVMSTSVAGQAYFQIWVWVSDSTQLQTISLRIDVNAGDFSQDYYAYTANRFSASQDVSNVAAQMEFRPDIPFFLGRPSLARRLIPVAAVPRNNFPLTTNGWTLLTIPLTSLQRIGASPGKDLSTTIALEVAFQASSAITVKFDSWQEIGNKQSLNLGDYYYYETFQHRDANNNLLNESNGSPISKVFRNPGGLGVVVTSNTTSGSGFVNWRGFYRIGGSLDQPYLVGTLTYAGGTQTFTDSMADIDALYTNIPLATDNNPAPAGYYYVEGPHYDRIFLGSGVVLRWTKVNFPHSFPNTNTAPLPGALSGDGIKKILRFSNRIFVFTITHVYEFIGDSEDNFLLRRTFSRTGTPAGFSVVDAGDRMLYLGGQGTSISGLFYHDGLIDHKISFAKLEPFFTGRESISGIKPLNTSAVSVVSAVFYKSCYWMAYPSGLNTLSDRVLRIDFSHESEGIPYMIYHYAAPSFINVLDVETVEGLLVAGGMDGFLYQLEAGNADNAAAMTWYWQSKDFPVSEKFDQHPLWQVGVDMQSQGQSVVASGLYDNSLYRTPPLGTATTTLRDWITDIKGETTQVPRRNVSIKLSGTSTKEVQIYGLKVDVVNKVSK